MPFAHKARVVTGGLKEGSEGLGAARAAKHARWSARPRHARPTARQPVVARALVGAREVSLEAAEQLDLRTALRRPELQPEGGRRVLGPVVPACVGRVHRARCVEGRGRV